jgi:type IV secretion system protein TrbL
MIKRILLFLLVTGPLFAQAAPTVPTDVNQILLEFQRATQSWLTTGEQVASGLFGILATIELAITVCMLGLAGERDVTVWGATFVKKFMAVGAFYALLLLGPALMTSFVNSFVQYGQMASGVTGITASNILSDGIEIVLTLLAAAIQAGTSLSIFTSLLLLLCAACIGWGFIKLVKSFVIAKLESFIILSLGAIQLGWGASRFTSIYAERYVSAAIAVGIKLSCFYFILGVERTLAPGWIAGAKQSVNVFGGFAPAIILTFSIVLFCAVADADKLTSLLFSGQLSFSGHDVTNAYVPHVNAGLNIASQAITGVTSGFGGGLVGAAVNSFRRSNASEPSPAFSMAAAAGASGSRFYDRPQTQPPEPPKPPPPRPPSTPPPPPKPPTPAPESA